jgi:hypothetical protein
MRLYPSWDAPKVVLEGQHLEGAVRETGAGIPDRAGTGADVTARNYCTASIWSTVMTPPTRKVDQDGDRLGDGLGPGRIAVDRPLGEPRQKAPVAKTAISPILDFGQGDRGLLGGGGRFGGIGLLSNESHARTCRGKQWKSDG